MTALTLKYGLEPEHFARYSAMQEGRMRPYYHPLGKLPRLLLLSVPFCLLMALLYQNAVGKGLVPPGLLLPVLFALLAGVAVGVVIVRYCGSFELDLVTPDGPLIGVYELTAGPHGMVVAGPKIRDEIDWSAVSEVTETPEQIVVWLDFLVGIIVPAAAFGSQAQREAFLGYVRSKMVETAAG
ncbi:MAG: YcxB family protein [Methyloligellaceae bacterium]